MAGDVEAARIGRPGDRLDRSVPPLGQRAILAGAQIADVEHQPIRLVCRPLHRRIGQPAPVGGHHWQAVGRLVGGGEVGGRRRSVRRHREDIHVGRGRFDPPRLAQREIDRAAVRRPGKLGLVAERLGGAVPHQIGRERDAVAHRLAALHRQHEQLRSRSVTPHIPVADEQLVVGARAAGVRILLHHRLLERGGARPPIGPHQQLVAGGRQAEAADPHPAARRLHRRAAGHVDMEQLALTARAIGDEPQRPVLGEGGRALVGARQRGELRRSGARRLQIQPPQVRPALVGVQVGLALLPHQPATVGRHRGCGDAREGYEVLRGQRPGGGGAGEERCGGEREDVLHGQGLARPRYAAPDPSDAR